jgi:hypothetical protein
VAKRLNIKANIIAAAREAWAARLEIVKISWFPMLLVLLYRKGEQYFHEYIKHRDPKFFSVDYFTFHIHFDYYNFLFNVVETVLYSIFFIAILRYLLLGEAAVFKTYNVKKGGLYEDKIIFRLPIYFKFGRRELLYAIILLVLSFPFRFVWDFLLYCIGHVIAVNYAHGFHHNPGLSLLYWFLKYWVKDFSSGVYFGLFTMFGPYIAVKNRFSSQDFLQLVKAMLGNILRIGVISFFIYLPHHLMKDVQDIIAFDLGLSKHPTAYAIEYELYVNLHSILYFMCSVVSLIFAVNVYRNFQPEFGQTLVAKNRDIID